MYKIFKFLFSRIYNSTNRSAGKKDQNLKTASALMGFLIAFNVISIFCIPLILFNSQYSLIVYILIGAITVLIVSGYLRIKGRYKMILQEVDDYADETKLKLKRISAIYIIISISLFAWVWFKINVLPF
jgi:hypothetical protein